MFYCNILQNINFSIRKAERAQLWLCLLYGVTGWLSGK